MNPEWKEKWVNALRSGKYKQARGYLRTGDNRFCCLGVLCDVSNKVEWLPVPCEVLESTDYYRCNNSAGSFTPEDILEMTGLTLNDQDELVNLNDKVRYDFEEIADYIEANL